jgi:hypothetical protein
MMRRPQFSLKTLLWLMAVVAAWCAACRVILSEVRHPILRTALVCSLVVATVGIACLAHSAMMNIGQDWKLGAVQFGWSILGAAMLMCAALLWFAGLWFAWAASAG